VATQMCRKTVHAWPKDLVVIEGLARSYIADVLQVPDEMTVYRTRDRLEPLSAFVPAAAFGVLRAKEHVLRRHVGLQGLTVGIAHPDIAVGTPIAERPPHRTERARFRHSAPTLGI
jgi:hypothetical protein